MNNLRFKAMRQPLATGILALNAFIVLSLPSSLRADSTFTTAQSPNPAPMIRTFRSQSGRTVVQIMQGKNWDRLGASIGTYQTDDNRGNLVNTGKDDPMGFYTQFEDTTGTERCVGRMHLFIGDAGYQYGSKTTWQVDGAVRGYRCSTIGQSFELKMEQINPNTLKP